MALIYSAVKILLKHNNKYLVIKQNFKGTVYYDLPGGRIEYGEDPYETLHREIKEELGIEVSIKQCLGMYHFIRTLTDQGQVNCTVFVCTPSSLDIDLTHNPVDDENITEYFWVEKEKLPTFFENKGLLNLFHLL